MKSFYKSIKLEKCFHKYRFIALQISVILSVSEESPSMEGIFRLATLAQDDNKLYYKSEFVVLYIF